MSTYTALVFGALVILGAIIAYLGDVTGAWLGKRRSSVFGLRPRQSARLVAAVIGALLPLLGLMVATIGSGYARIAVFELRQLLQRQEDLQARISDLQSEVTRLDREAAGAGRRADTAEHRAQELEGLREDAERRVGELTERRDELAGRVDTLIRRRGQLEVDLEAAQSDLNAARADLDASEQELNVTQEELDRKRREVEAKRHEVETISHHLEMVSRDLERAQRHLEPTIEHLEATTAELEAREQELASIEQRLEQAWRQQRLIAERPALYEPGEELIRVVLAADETQDQMESDLYELLHLASAAAKRRGVPEGANGRAVVAVAPIPDWAPAEEVPEGMIVRYVASELREGGAEEWVVTVRAFRRLFPGEETQLAVGFRAAPNRLVFSEGEVLDEFLISSGVSSLQAFETLWLRITNPKESRVRARAISEGMLPHPETGSYGSIDLAELFNAAEATRAGEGMMRVRVMAAGDTYTRGPLLLDLEVSAAPEPP